LSSLSKPTLVLDLDETLIRYDRENQAGSFIGVETRDIEVEGSLLVIALRPYVQQFLSSLAAHYELVVWTAGTEPYGRAIVKVLDPSGSLISHSLYRQHCTCKDNHFIKDLSRLGRDDVRLLDNNPVSYSLQPSKGIPVRDFLGDPQDFELLRLLNDLRPDLEIIDISFEPPQPALSLDIPADQSLDVEAAPEGFDDDASMEILVGLFKDLRIVDHRLDVEAAPEGFGDDDASMEILVDLFKDLRIVDHRLDVEAAPEGFESANEVRDESDSFGTHLETSYFIFLCYHRSRMMCHRSLR